MRFMNLENLWRSKIRRFGGFLIIMIAVTILPGCGATSTKGVPKYVGKGISVKRLKHGQEGFVIRETPSMNGESRRDFKSAVAMLNDQKYEEAIVLLEKVIESKPGVTAPYINIAMAYIRIDKPEPAEKYLKTALELVPNHPVAGIEYGLLLRKSGRFDEARKIYEKTLSAFPEYMPAHRNLGILCDLYLNDRQCALKQYEIYFNAMPDDKQVKMWIADLHMRLGK